MIIPYHPPPIAAAVLFFGLLNVACAAEPSKPPTAAAAAATADPATQPSPQPFAVVELFTSEGCSSCPPADQLLSDMTRDARAGNRQIFPLAFHVDYWDRLGWRDPFSDPAYSDRQRAYGRALRTDAIYTPQMVINGAVEFVGSDRNRATPELAKALGRPATLSVRITLKPGRKPDTLTVEYAVDRPPPANAVLNIALAERGLETRVLRGENANRTLRHDNVVRAFRSLPLDKSQGQTELPLPAKLLRKNASVIAYVQDEAMHTLAATGADLSPG